MDDFIQRLASRDVKGQITLPLHFLSINAHQYYKVSKFIYTINLLNFVYKWSQITTHASINCTIDLIKHQYIINAV